MALTAIGKALAVLDLLLAAPDGLRAADLTRQTGYPAGTVHRLLGELMEAGYARRDAVTNRYLLGDKIMPARSPSGPSLSIQRQALPHMRTLAHVVGHGANLGVLRRGQLVFLESLVADNAGTVMYTPPGTSAPAHCTAMGKVLLSELPEPRLRDYLATTLTACSPRSLTAPAAIREELERIRVQEYAVDREEYHLGVRCIAAPLRDQSGWAVAALSVSIPVQEAQEEQIAGIAEQVVAAARATSHDLGFRVKRDNEQQGEQAG